MTQSNGEVTYIIQKEHRENNSWHFKKYEVQKVWTSYFFKVFSEDASINDIVKYDCITVINLYNLFKLFSKKNTNCKENTAYNHLNYREKFYFCIAEMYLFYTLSEISCRLNVTFAFHSYFFRQDYEVFMGNIYFLKYWLYKAPQKKCPCLEFFWFIFSRIQTEHRDLLCKPPYSSHMRENLEKLLTSILLCREEICHQQINSMWKEALWYYMRHK